MRSSVRNGVAGVATAALGTALIAAPVASADWNSQYNATQGKAWENCFERAGQFGHGGCVNVEYVTSREYPGAAGNRYFQWNIRFTNHTCSAEYHISASNHIFYADWAGPCF